MSEFKTAKELAQHIANIAPRGAVVSFKDDYVAVRLTQAEPTPSWKGLQHVRDDQADAETPEPEVAGPRRPVGAAMDWKGADPETPSARPTTPSISGLSNRLDSQRVILKSFLDKLSNVEGIQDDMEDELTSLGKRISRLEAAIPHQPPMPHYPDIDTGAEATTSQADARFMIELAIKRQQVRDLKLTVAELVEENEALKADRP